MAFSFISLHSRLLLTECAIPSGKVMWAGGLKCGAFSLWPLETLASWSIEPVFASPLVSAHSAYRVQLDGPNIQNLKLCPSKLSFLPVGPLISVATRRDGRLHTAWVCMHAVGKHEWVPIDTNFPSAVRALEEVSCATAERGPVVRQNGNFNVSRIHNASVLASLYVARAFQTELGIDQRSRYASAYLSALSHSDGALLFVSTTDT